MENQRVIELPKSGLIRGLVLTGVFILAACCLVVFMLPLALDDAQYLNTSIHLSRSGVIVPGTVTELEASYDNPNTSDQVSYILTVEYVVDGQTYSVRNQDYINGYGKGDTIDVIYDPEDPSIAQVNLFWERWISPIIEMIPF
jgi:hypothetical protein